MNKEVIDRINTLMASAFGLVAALAWNDAIKALFVEIFGTAGTILAMFLYAIIVTIIVVWATKRLAVLSEKASNISIKDKITIKKK